MTKTEWLYDVTPEAFDGLKFYDAIRERIRLAKEALYREVHEGKNRNGRVRDIQEAIAWGEKLLRERYEKIDNKE